MTTAPPLVALQGELYRLPAELPAGADPAILKANLDRANPSPDPAFEFLSLVLGPEYARLVDQINQDRIDSDELSDFIVRIYGAFGMAG